MSCRNFPWQLHTTHNATKTIEQRQSGKKVEIDGLEFGLVEKEKDTQKRVVLDGKKKRKDVGEMIDGL